MKTMSLNIYIICIWKVFILFELSYSDPICKPVIIQTASSQQNIGGFVFLECDISTCDKVSKIEFEKNGVKSEYEWTSVFEGINKTHYKAVVTGSEYTLENRNDYSAFIKKHVLYIDDLSLKDQGKWRCVACFQNNTKVESEILILNIVVIPDNTKVSIKPRIIETAAFKQLKFLCEIAGINPEPEIVWRVNSTKYTNGQSNNLHDDTGLWTVQNTIALNFNKLGQVTLICEVKLNGRTQNWSFNSIQFQVKESLCMPNIIEGSSSQPNVDGFLFVECDISTCDNVSKIIYEKKGFSSNDEWTQVFEGMNDTHHHAIDRNMTNTLAERNDYIAFHTKHVLYIEELTKHDGGEWRCVVQETRNLLFASHSINIDILESLCKPYILQGSSSQPKIGGFLFVECDITTCKSVSRLLYEKKGIKYPTEWTPLFEGINKTYYHDLSTGTEYTLAERNDYMDFDTKHVLYIEELTKNDEGEWRCVVQDHKDLHFGSQSLQINILAIQQDDDSLKDTCLTTENWWTP